MKDRYRLRSRLGPGPSVRVGSACSSASGGAYPAALYQPREPLENTEPVSENIDVGWEPTEENISYSKLGKPKRIVEKRKEDKDHDNKEQGVNKSG